MKIIIFTILSLLICLYWLSIHNHTHASPDETAVHEAMSPHSSVEFIQDELDGVCSHLFSTQVETVDDPDLVLFYLRHILENHTNDIATPTTAENHETRMAHIRKLIEMSGDLGCRSQSLFRRSHFASLHRQYPHIKSYLEIHRRKQLALCRRRLEHDVKRATRNIKSQFNLLDAIRRDIETNLSHLTPIEDKLTLNLFYVDRAVKSMQRMMLNDQFVRLFHRRPRQSYDDYRDDFVDRLLDLFDSNCLVLEEAGLYSLAAHYQRFNDKLTNLNVRPMLDQVGGGTLTWLQRAIICVCVEKRIGKIMKFYVRNVYDPLEMMQQLRKKPGENGASIELLSAQEVSDELKFIKSVASHHDSNNAQMARLNYQLDNYLGLTNPMQDLRYCDTDKLYELNRMGELDLQFPILAAFHATQFPAYLTKCFALINDVYMRRIHSLVELSSISVATNLRGAILQPMRDEHSPSDGSVIEAVKSHMRAHLNGHQVNLRVFAENYQATMIEHCADYRTHLRVLWNDLIELPSVINGIESYYSESTKEMVLTIEICKKILGSKQIFDEVAMDLGYKSRHKEGGISCMGCVASVNVLD